MPVQVIMHRVFFSSALLLVAFVETSAREDLAHVKFDGGWPEKLDYGLYFFSADNVPQKYVSGQRNSFFDPSQPTFIYFHGWEPGTIEKGFRETFDYHLNSPDQCPKELVESKYWVQKGWNIGIFYWDQFADEPEPWKAEAKIWSSKGSEGMRYRTASGDWHTAGIPSGASVTDLCVTAFLNLAEASQPKTPQDVRFAGGSLGSQLASHCAAKLQEQAASGKLPSAWVPTRIAFLDPYFSSKAGGLNSENYLPQGVSAADATNQAVTALFDKSGVAFELYRSSYISSGRDFFGEENLDLRKYAVYVHRKPTFCNGRSDSEGTDASPLSAIAAGISNIPVVGELLTNRQKIACEHKASWNLYFLSMGFSPPRLCNAPQSQSLQCTTPSASCQDSELKKLTGAARNIHRHFVQAKGMDTISIEDDCFELMPDQEPELLLNLAANVQTEKAVTDESKKAATRNVEVAATSSAEKATTQKAGRSGADTATEQASMEEKAIISDNKAEQAAIASLRLSSTNETPRFVKTETTKPLALLVPAVAALASLMLLMKRKGRNLAISQSDYAMLG